MRTLMASSLHIQRHPHPHPNQYSGFKCMCYFRDENNPIIGLRIFSYAIIHEIGTIMYMSKVSSRNVNSKVGSRNV